MKQLLLIILTGAIIASCQKAAGPIANMTLNVVNASPGVTNAKVKTPNAYGFYSQLSGVNYGSNNVFTIPVGAAVTVAASSDTTHTLYSNTFTTGTVYSLFIGGASGGDIILNQDNNIPYRVDSSFGVRFVNMSYSSSPVNVALYPAVSSDFSSVAYKSITDFKSYSVKATDPTSFKFEVKDSNGDSLTVSPALSANTYRFHNVTLVLKGTYPSGLSVFTVNNY